MASGLNGRVKNAPTLRRWRGLLPPKGALLPWDGPAAKECPHAALLTRLAASKGALSPWGGPVAKECLDVEN